jgi:hypothetical protein
VAAVSWEATQTLVEKSYLMKHHWLIIVRCGEFTGAEEPPKETSRFILLTPDSECPSASVVFDLISELRLNNLPGVNTTTTEYHLGRLVGQIERFIYS